MAFLDRAPDQIRSIERLRTATAAGRLSRRELLRATAALGVSTTALGALATPSSASPIAGSRLRQNARFQGDPKSLTIGSYGAPSDLDPHSAYDYRSCVAIRGPYEGLIGLKDDKTDEYVGLIAESWEANDDSSVWTFQLREGVTFQDGSPCDAEAVRASYERFLTMGLGPVNVIKRFVDNPAKITAPDPLTVVFDLGQPQLLFEAAMAATYGPQIVNVKVAKEHEEAGDWGNLWVQSNAEGMGTGPYKIVQFDPADQLIMERHEEYWGGWTGSEFDRVVIRIVTENETRRQLIERGEVDIIDNLTPEALEALAENPDIILDRSYSTQVEYFILTVAGPLQSPEARQAMCYAFPYQEVNEGVFKGFSKSAVGPVAELIRGFDPNTFQYSTDLAKAKELFTAAGVAEGTELRLVQETGDEGEKAAAQLFQANLAEIGITLTIELVDTATHTDILYGDAPAEERPNVMDWGWWPDYNDAWNHLYPQVSCDAWGSKGSNAGFYCNERAEELLTTARDAPDEATYQEALSELQQILSRDDPPAIYYRQPEWPTVLRADIDGFVFNPINIGTYEFHRLSRIE